MALGYEPGFAWSHDIDGSRTLRLPQPCLVDSRDLEGESKAGIANLDALLWGLRDRFRKQAPSKRLLSAGIDVWARRAAAKCGHRLQQAFVGPGLLAPGVTGQPRALRSLLEARAVGRYCSHVAKCLSGPVPNAMGLAELLADVNGAIGEAGRYRTGPVGNPVDSQGVRILFVDAQMLPGAVRELLASIASAWPQSPGLAYAQAHACIGLLHPFSDGNGRSSRVLASCLLSAWLDFELHVPLGSLAEHNPAAWLLSLREAAYFGDYAALASVLYVALEEYGRALESIRR